MNDFKIDRRDFLKALGWTGAGAALAGCDLPTTVTLEEGAEEVVSYRLPKEYAIPGVAVWYASTCAQCPAACGIHGRIREGRVLKVEGNPDSPVNAGRTCMMGQAGLQNHYNPDRLTRPMQRENGRLVPISWDDALALLKSKVGKGGEIPSGKTAWFTGQVSGHQAVLIDEHLKRLGGGRHYSYELVSEEVWRRVCQDMLGDPDPRLDFSKADLVVSFGADFLGTGRSPVYFAKEYAAFRRHGERGVLVVVEPKMTLTGANADLWLTPRPGTEGALALGVAHVLMKRDWIVGELPAQVKALIERHDPRTVSEITGVAGDRIQRVAFLLHEKEGRSLVLAGSGVTAQEKGYQAAAAAMLLNIVVGNVGSTIQPGMVFPEPALAPRVATTKALVDFAEDIEKGEVQAVFIYNSNPVYTAPGHLKMKERFAGVPFKVVLTQFKDETAMEADLVLPLHSYLEDWGTHVPAIADRPVLSLQQPLMKPLYGETRGFGDLLLTLLKDLDESTFGAFPDYYTYLKTAMENAPSQVTGGVSGWEKMLQKGVLLAQGDQGAALQAKPKAEEVLAEEEEGSERRPFRLIPAPRMGMWDGRHANLPWIQEAPDPIAKVVWGSWAELHPRTARELGVKNGDYIRIESDHGAIETQVYVHNGINPEAVAVPLGQGHEHYGRYAKGRGVNPLRILAPVNDATTGELALYATRVSIAKTGRSEQLNKMGGSETQAGRKLVATIPASVYRRTEGEV